MSEVVSKVRCVFCMVYSTDYLTLAYLTDGGVLMTNWWGLTQVGLDE